VWIFAASGRVHVRLTGSRGQFVAGYTLHAAHPTSAARISRLYPSPASGRDRRTTGLRRPSRRPGIRPFATVCWASNGCVLRGRRPSLPWCPCTRTIPPVPAVRPTVAIRPIEASTVAVRYVRNTSTVDIRSVPMNVCKGSKGPMDLARGREARRISFRNRRPRCARLQTTLADIHHDRSNIACRHEADIPGRRGGMRSLRFSSCQREFRNDGQSRLLQRDPNETNV